MRRFFGRKDNNKTPTRSLLDIYDAYRARPVVPPDSLYPLLKQAYNLTYNFVGLGDRQTTSEIEHPGVSHRVYWSRIVTDTEREMSTLENALAALRAIRVDDEHPELMMVQAQSEMYVGQLHGYYNWDAAAHQALFYGTTTEHANYSNLALKY